MCCGNKRRAVAAIKPTLPVMLEYRGDGSLTVVGSVTRRIYWFSRHGARVALQPGDAEPLSGDPDLIRVDISSARPAVSG